MAKNKKGTDPFAEREATRYEQPVASREFILQILSDVGPCSEKELCKLLNIAKHDKQQTIAIERRLNAMLRDRQVTKLANHKFEIIDKSQLVRGKVLLHRDSYGFLSSPDCSDDLYIDYHQARLVFDGDEVLASAIKHKSGKLEAKIIEVTKRNTERVVGKLLADKNTWRVIPENPKNHLHSIYIDKELSVQAEPEQLVVVEITRQPWVNQPARGIIISVLGNYNTPGIEVDIALSDFAIPHQWPKEALKECDKLADNPNKKDKQGRVDLTALPFITIDGEDAKDFDDAVYCQTKKSGGWRLWVAIADVSHYVQRGTALDDEAQNRATSVYFPDYVVPMLPEALSNGLCSLKPDVDRLSLVCEMTISAQGRLSGYTFYPAVIHSHARLTYNEVQRLLLDKRDSRLQTNILRSIEQLHLLFQALFAQRQLRGAMDFDSVEIQAIFDENRKIKQLEPRTRNTAHRIIEECMLSANVAAARFLQKAELTSLFRIHEGPSEKKLAALRDFLAPLGLNLSGGKEPKPADYQALSAQIEERNDKLLIQSMLLRSMSQAVYQVENKGHFGLAYPAYVHFTSPIRRYPDLLVHRLIHSVVNNNQNTQQQARYSTEALVQLGEHCSMAERRADEASRDVLSHLKCVYLQQYIGQQFQGRIQTVVPFGLFVELDGLYCEGLVHISELDDDFYHYDGKQYLIGERTKQIFKMGDKVSVLVKQVQVEERKIHLSLARQNKATKKVVRKRKKS